MSYLPIHSLSAVERVEVIERIGCWLQHPICLRQLIHWPLLRELFEPRLHERIDKAMQSSVTSLAAPFKARFSADKHYFYPGTWDECVKYHAAVVRCLPAITQVVTPAMDSWDFGPPPATDLIRSEPGDLIFMRQYWRRFSKQFLQYQVASRIVVNADVRRSFSSIDMPELVRRLVELQAPSDAVYQLEQCSHRWQQHDCAGLPLVFASWPLFKLYLLQVDAKLQTAGLTFIRLGDDYRLFCQSVEEGHLAINILENSLAEHRLTLARDKTWLERVGNRVDQAERLRRSWLGCIKEGIMGPLLGHALPYRLTRPLSLRLLQRYRYPSHRALQVPAPENSC